MSSRPRVGPPEHANKFAWKPNAGVKINETEVGGRFRPLSEITGVCPKCKDQIEWKRKYGKYKPLKEPAKCQKCSKRAVRQAYHKLCTACAGEHDVCAKCSLRIDEIVARRESKQLQKMNSGNGVKKTKNKVTKKSWEVSGKVFDTEKKRYCEHNHEECVKEEKLRNREMMVFDFKKWMPLDGVELEDMEWYDRWFEYNDFPLEDLEDQPYDPTDG